MTAMQSITLTVGGSSIKVDQMGVTIQGMMIKITGDIMTQVQGEAILILKGGITMIN
jgi:type VI secretion system secreted protein VgrG